MSLDLDKARAIVEFLDSEEYANFETDENCIENTVANFCDLNDDERKTLIEENSSYYDDEEEEEEESDD